MTNAIKDLSETLLFWGPPMVLFVLSLYWLFKQNKTRWFLLVNGLIAIYFLIMILLDMMTTLPQSSDVSHAPLTIAVYLLYAFFYYLPIHAAVVVVCYLIKRHFCR